MQELRFVAVSEDGSYAVLAVPGRSARFTLPIDERLRAVALGQTSRLAQYEIEVESPLRPKEIQARIRAGETAEEIADAAGIPLERVRWFEGPVLAERAYIADQAQTATVRRLGDSAGPGPRLGDIVTERMSASGADPEDGQWDSRKRGDGSWQVQLTFSAGGRLHIAEWVFDPRRRHVMPEDDNAARLSLPESELPPLAASMPGEATVTPIAPRLGAAAGMSSGGGSGMGSVGGRFRTERPGGPTPSVSPTVSQPAAFYEPDRHTPYEPDQYVPAPPPIPAPPAPASLPPAADRATTAPWVVVPAPDGHQPPEFETDPTPTLAAEPAATEPAATEPAATEPAPAEPMPAEPTSAEPAPAEPTPTELAATPTPAPAEPTPAPAPAPAAVPEPTPVQQASAAEPVRAAEPAPASHPEPTAASAASVPQQASAPQQGAATPEVPAKQAVPSKPESTPAQAAPAEADSTQVAPVEASPAKTEADGTKNEPAAAKAEPATPAEPAASAAPATPAEPAAGEESAAAADDQSARSRSGKKNARGRRSSVPSWDEIMLGSSRQRD
jgi:Protein of unknown function (DUF3071)